MCMPLKELTFWKGIVEGGILLVGRYSASEFGGSVLSRLYVVQSTSDGLAHASLIYR